MIDIIYAPKENEVFQNSAPIPVKVRSTLGSDYYFTLTILVNGEEYDVQTVSKYNDYDGEIDLQNIIQSIFTQEYVPVTTTEIVEQTELMKSVQLTVTEYNQATNVAEPSLDLPLFYVVNSNEIEAVIFNQLLNLSVYDSVIKAPENSLLQLPIFSNKTFTIEILKNNEAVFNDQVSEAFGIYNCKINLAELAPDSTNNSITINIATDTESITLNVLLQAYTGYTPQLLAIQNNYNCWEHFYTFGSSEELENITRKKSTLSNYVNNTYRVISKSGYKINTGHYNTTYANTVNKILKTYNTLLLEDGVFTAVELQNKKTTPVPQRSHIFNTSIDLVKNQETIIDNATQFTELPTAVNFSIDGIENVLTAVNKSLFSDHFNDTPTAIIFSEETALNTVNVLVGVTSSPVVYGQEYSWSSFQGIQLTATGYGEPYTEVSFKLKNTENFSNTARVLFNILANDPNNQPPSISMPSEAYVYEDVSSTTITATVTDPEDDPFTLLWTQVGGQQITMTNTQTASLTLSNWIAIGEYEFQLTATDNRGNSSTQNIILNVMDYKVNVAVNHNSICVYGGKEGQTIYAHIDIENTVVFSRTATAVPTGTKGNLYGLSINGERILTAQAEEDGYSNGTTRINVTDDVSNLNIPLIFPASGEVNIPIGERFSAQLANGLADNVEKLNLNLRSHLKVTLHSKSGGIEYGKQTAVDAQIIYLNA